MRTKKNFRHWQLLLYLLFGAVLRFWNFPNSLYFIYDQGRDALVLRDILAGHPVLVGPISGLQGFFLGPLWYYIGLPGYVLGGGNPYVISLWYIFISCSALPLFWILAHKLFREKIWAVVCAVLLAATPASIQASIFIWNPLLSVPLMTGAVLALSKAREARRWLVLGFLLLALTLQSEFAYGIFFLPPLFLAIPWLRKQRKLPALALDYVSAAIAVGITLIPQLLFELRNGFVMTRTLLSSMGDTSQSVPWKFMWTVRPIQLLNVTHLLLLGEDSVGWMFTALLGLLLFLSILAMIQKLAVKKFSPYLWLLMLVFAIIPYPFYLLWRGNHGYFFSYYMTPHFVFLVPFIVLGLQEISHLGKRLFERTGKHFFRFLMTGVVCASLVFFGRATMLYMRGVVVFPENNAGLAKMLMAVQQLYAWHKEDGGEPWVIKTYTANVYTEQYDYLYGWYGRTRSITPPRTVRTNDETVWYVVIESRASASPFFLTPWYAAATANGHKTRETQIGVLTLETWRK